MPRLPLGRTRSSARTGSLRVPLPETANIRLHIAGANGLLRPQPTLVSVRFRAWNSTLLLLSVLHLTWKFRGSSDIFSDTSLAFMSHSYPVAFPSSSSLVQ